MAVASTCGPDPVPVPVASDILPPSSGSKPTLPSSMSPLSSPSSGSKPIMPSSMSPLPSSSSDTQTPPPPHLANPASHSGTKNVAPTTSSVGTLSSATVPAKQKHNKLAELANELQCPLASAFINSGITAANGATLMVTNKMCKPRSDKGVH
ncbi:hypothetical protein B0H34DRAFT_799962 [Crassisporium funariophilum]|nr:hypothetical protein B0H34DRAFT_799962 [Crassisporium funariophilum]